ncbi:MAG: DUF4233 domain-containing protein [Actinomycetota bacterium]|nr:DUF4233 domain-containing protein [Actinomycetota bacterium]
MTGADPRPAPDPWKGLRGVMAAILILESVSVLLTLLVVTKISGNGGPVGVGVVLALAVAMISATQFLARPWGIGLVVALQLAMIGCGFLVPVLGALGVVFGLVWTAILLMRRDVARRMDRGELPSQR